ncbi:hypothetical protein AJ78_02582 [Emergomyces pasteurianus Ep9510]|uniref:PQ loop repeat protein n=1 Tax=Emergomyces pasteurianus Ep9510 TaxID=1447872 RepID=A0A1J9PMG2_9EURO|nr:hypothetical protein AJ78_02582 [Emergomyces pasteurianus Ep9510]
MTSAWLYSPLVASVPDHCEPSSPFLTFISSRLHTCIPTPLALISSTLGTLSIVSWLFAQLPQIYKNYKLQSTSSLSVWFLIEWCLGDSTNLMGAILLHQAGWQITVAAYYVFVDVVLVFQYYFYTYIKSWQLRIRGYSEPSDLGFNDGDMYNGIIPTEENTILGLSPGSIKPSEPKTATSKKGLEIDSPWGNSLARPNEKQSSPSRAIYRVGGRSNVTPSGSPRTILLLSMLCAVLANAAATNPNEKNDPVSSQSQTDARQIAGRIASWSSTFLYLGSRIPQLYKNYGRKSTSGLSPLLFFAAFCGNFFYSSSLLTNPNAWSDYPAYGNGGWVGKEGNNRLEWIGRAVPFFLGAFGVLGMDGAMSIQFLIYKKKNEDVDAAIMLRSARRGRSRGRWGRVSGWMKGWIPSSPERKSPSAETEALMIDGQDRYGAV